MQRLQKKCFFGSLATHFVLVGVLMAGTAFMGDKTFPQLPMQLEQQIPINLVQIDGLTDGPSQLGGGGGGGSPSAPPAVATPQPVAPPPPAPEQPAPPVVQPPPPPVVETPRQPAIEAVVEPPRQDPRPSLRPADQKKKAEKTPPPKDTAKSDSKKEAPKQETKKVAVNLKSVDRGDDLKSRQKAAADAEKKQKAAADAKSIRDYRARQKEMAKAIGSTLEGLEKGLSTSGGGLDVASFGSGSGKGWGVGSGPTLMNYAQYVREMYDMNWTTESVVADTGVVQVEVVVQRNGAARGRIVKTSGNAVLDRSVQNALDRVKTIGRPFPEGATDSSRTFIINFNMKSRRQAG